MDHRDATGRLAGQARVPQQVTAAGGEEVLHESASTRISRYWPSPGDRAFILKQPLGPGSMDRVRTETQILQRLAGVPGVPRLAQVQYPGGIVLEDDGGTTVAAAARTEEFDLGAVVELGRALATTIAGLHRRGVVHKDLNPANLLLAGPGRVLTLIDFDIATTFAVDRPAFSHQSQIIGTLAYLPPEQTGRTGRPIDHRADLYALGAVLYELVSGRPPFDVDDDLELMHDILLRVPVPLVEAAPGVPPALSQIVSRLLEKEPDRRYQSADGVARDLDRVAKDPAAAFGLGEWDFPLRLAAPSRLVGRDDEIALLGSALDQAIGEGTRSVLLAGSPGVGKSALIDELRPAVAARGGWFVAGKCDQYCPDGSAGAVLQAVGVAAQLLLAQSGGDLQETSDRLRQGLGANAALLSSVLPEFAALVGATAPGTTPDTASGTVPAQLADSEARLAQALADLIRLTASADRPLVMVLDDLQWADQATLDQLDALLTAPPARGLLIVGSYRSQDVDAAHPLTALRSRWARLALPQSAVMLENLPPDELSGLLAGMLRLPAAQVGELATVVQSWTAGNPFDTVELVNALRRDEVLVLGDTGWTWNPRDIARYVGRGDVVDLIQDRIAALPDGSRELLQAIACLGSDTRIQRLVAALDLSSEEVRARLRPALEDGLLILDRDGTRRAETGGDGVRFRHDRVRQAAHTSLDAAGRSALHLALGRRLAATSGHETVAAAQYLATDEPIRDPDEQAQVARLYQTAAGQVRRTSNLVTAERLLAAASRLWHDLAIAADDPALLELETQWHAVLHALGRVEDCDRLYASITRRCTDPLQLACATGAQVSSLTQRNRHHDAVNLGLELIIQLGAPVQDAATGPSMPVQLAALVDWAGHLDLAADLARPEIGDARVLAVDSLISRMLPATFFTGEPALVARLVLASQRMWVEHGPSAGLAANLSCAGLVAMPALQDFRLGYTVGRHVLAVAEARDYEPSTSVLRHRFALHAQHWIEPLENCLGQAQLARDGLVRGGDLQMAGHTALTVMASLLETGRSLETLEAELDAASAFAARTGNEHNGQIGYGYRHLAGVLMRPGDRAAGGPGDGVPEELRANRMATGVLHICRSIAAAILGDPDELARATQDALVVRRGVPGYLSTLVPFTRSLALAGQIGPATPEARLPLLAELDEHRGWLAARAADAPANFLHLSHLIEAERAGALGDFEGAWTAYDAATVAGDSTERPWHQALIAERMGRFALSHGLVHAGQLALARARQGYLSWGASAKVSLLDAEYPSLRSTSAPVAAAATTRPNTFHTTKAAHATSRAVMASLGQVNTDALDMVAILRACQALSSQTRVDRLQDAMVEQLSSLTGATEVLLVLRDEASQKWFLPARGPGQPGLPVEEAGRRGLLPLRAFRYAERTQAPLVLDNAVADERFAGDQYLADLSSCSLLVAPITSQGTVQGMLILSNQHGSGAFTDGRLDAVLLISGQLTVSLRNAQLYASLEARVADRTNALATANEQLETLSTTDPLTALGNRRQFTRVLADQWALAVDGQDEIGIVMIDVDHFKAFNDHYGHQAGDECLRQVGARLGGMTRGGSDPVCRYGGEEFVIVVPHADAAICAAVGERARQAVASLAMPHLLSERGIVTVSVGVASAVASCGTTADQVLARADAALYRAKEQGRNQVVAAPSLE